MSPARGRARRPRRGDIASTARAIATEIVAWLLGQDQSVASGHAAIVMTVKLWQGLSSLNKTLMTSLDA